MDTMKLNLIRVVVAMAMTLVVGISANAYDFEVDEIYYKITSDVEPYTVAVTYGVYDSPGSYTGDVVVPEYVTFGEKTYHVTSVGQHAFGNCSELINVQLPSSIVSIGADGFYSCVQLESVNIPDGVTKIGAQCFMHCHRLQSITIPEGITFLHVYTFFDCGIKTVYWNAIACKSYTDDPNDHGDSWSGSKNPFTQDNERIRNQIITSFVFGDKVKEIPDFCCYHMSNLSSVNIPESVTTIREQAFNYSGLTSITIPGTVSEFYWRTFANMEKLNNITIEEGVEYIPQEAFLNCPNVRSIVIPESITRIETEAFEECVGLEEITLPSGITDLGEHVFYGCSKVWSLKITKSTPPDFTPQYLLPSANLSGVKLFVPKGAVEVYKNDVNWNVFKSIEEYEIKVANLSIEKELEIGIGKNKSLNPIVLPESADNRVLNYVSSDENIATIDENGVVTGVSRGNVVITVSTTDGSNISDECHVSVVQYAESITLDVSDEIILYVDEMAVLNAEVGPDSTDNKGVDWKSSDESVAVVENGVVTAIAAGNTDITATTIDGSKLSATCPIRVIRPETEELVINSPALPGSVVLYVADGEKQSLKFTPNSGYKLHSVTFNGEDVTEYVTENDVYVTPEIEEKAIVNVVFESDIPVEIETVYSSRVKVIAVGNKIIVKETIDGEIVNLYSENGMLINSVVSDGDILEFDVDKGKVYILKTGSKVVKVMI